jgi:hypothetical protein
MLLRQQLLLDVNLVDANFRSGSTSLYWDQAYVFSY